MCLYFRYNLEAIIILCNGRTEGYLLFFPTTFKEQNYPILVSRVRHFIGIYSSEQLVASNNSLALHWVYVRTCAKVVEEKRDDDAIGNNINNNNKYVSHATLSVWRGRLFCRDESG